MFQIFKNVCDLPLEERQLVLYVQDGISAVDDIIEVGAQVTCHDICNLKRHLRMQSIKR